MLVIGERINSSRKTIAAAIERRDADFIKKEAFLQKEAGADYIDINCGTLLEAEGPAMRWLIETVQEAGDFFLCVDSPDPEVIKTALRLCRNNPVIVNSITAEQNKANSVLPLVREYNTLVIALTMDEAGMPRTADERVGLAEKTLDLARKHGVGSEKIYFDPLVQPVGSDQTQAKALLESIPKIKALGACKTTCGLSNISFGLPDRTLLNSTFLAMCVAAGLDAVMIDPLNEKMMSALSAASVLTGDDRYCMDYIRRFRRFQVKAKTTRKEC